MDCRTPKNNANRQSTTFCFFVHVQCIAVITIKKKGQLSDTVVNIFVIICGVVFVCPYKRAVEP